MNGDRGGPAAAPERAGSRRALVVYERPREDTAQIAASIAGALAPTFAVRIAEICDTDPATCGDYDLIVTGSSTNAFRPGLRPGGPDVGSLREWLSLVPPAPGDRYCACFDTAGADRLTTGEPASARTARVLLERGYVVLSRQTFYLATATGPMRPSELRRAREWARSIAGRVKPRD